MTRQLLNPLRRGPLAALLVAAPTLGLAACGGGDEPDDEASAGSEQTLEDAMEDDAVQGETLGDDTLTAGDDGEVSQRTEVIGEAPPLAPGQPAPRAVLLVAVEVECPERRVFFDTGSAELSPEAESVLDQYARCLQATPAEPVELAGMTDPRGTEPFNQELARQRAQAVAGYLEAQGVERGFEIHAIGERGAIEDMPALWPLQRTVQVGEAG